MLSDWLKLDPRLWRLCYNFFETQVVLPNSFGWLVLARTSHKLSLQLGIDNNCLWNICLQIYMWLFQAWSPILFKDIACFFFCFFSTTLNISFFFAIIISVDSHKDQLVWHWIFWSSESGFNIWAQTVTFFFWHLKSSLPLFLVEKIKYWKDITSPQYKDHLTHIIIVHGRCHHWIPETNPFRYLAFIGHTSFTSPFVTR